MVIYFKISLSIFINCVRIENYNHFSVDGYEISICHEITIREEMYVRF